MARYTYTYNTSWLNTEILIEHWDGTYWFFFSRWTQGYDQNGNPTENIIYLWTGSWTMMAGNRNTYGYNGNQWMTEKTGESYSAGSWYFSSHEIFTIDGNGYPTEILYQYWNSGWYDSDRKKDIVWHAYSPFSGSGTFEFFIWESWSETEWTPEVRETTTYDGSGGFVRVQESWNGMGWVNALKETLFINWGLVQEDKVENWAGNQWIQTSGYRYFYSFSGIDMTEKIVQSYDAQYSDYINSLKYVYSDFLHVVGLFDPIMSDRQILVYPNPLKASFSVDCTGFQSDAEIRISSLDGKIIGLWNVNFNDQPVQLDLDQSRLIKGVYLLTITGKNWSGFQKIVIE
jgi:hypothetical protein